MLRYYEKLTGAVGSKQMLLTLSSYVRLFANDHGLKSFGRLLVWSATQSRTKMVPAGSR